MSHWVRAILEEVTSPNHKLPRHVREGLDRLAKIVETSPEAQFRTQELEFLADEIFMCADIKHLSQLLWQVTSIAGFQHFSIFVVNQGSANAFRTRMCASYNERWLEQYVEKSYRFLDPIATRASKSDGSFVFAETHSQSPIIRAFWKDAEAHGVGSNGFCHVSTHRYGARVAVSFSTTSTSEETYENIRLNGHDLKIIADEAIDRFCELSSGEIPDDNVLTDQEIWVLYKLATCSDPLTAFPRLLNCEVNKSLQASICRKLKVTTLFQAIAVASSKHWFDLLPFYSDEVVTPFSHVSLGCQSTSPVGLACSPEKSAI